MAGSGLDVIGGNLVAAPRFGLHHRVDVGVISAMVVNGQKAKTHLVCAGHSALETHGLTSCLCAKYPTQRH